LGSLGVSGMTVTEVLVPGPDRIGQTGGFGPSGDLHPKLKLEIAIRDDLVDEVVERLTTTLEQSHAGSSYILIADLPYAERIRTREKGPNAL
jgi:nitrogen regulatory protein P-II 2